VSEEKKRDLALRLGGVGLCSLMFSELKLKDDPNNTSEIQLPKIITQGAGFSLTLDFMVRLTSKHSDFMLTELMSLMPSLKCIGEFMDRMPSYKVTAEEFEYLVKLGHII
jgi:hypothetical protein